MNESKKREFVDLVITALEKEKEALNQRGFDPTYNTDDLKARKQHSIRTAVDQQGAAATTNNARSEANKALEEAYRSASYMVDLISGLLDKDNELMKKIHELRNCSQN